MMHRVVGAAALGESADCVAPGEALTACETPDLQAERWRHATIPIAAEGVGPRGIQVEGIPKHVGHYVLAQSRVMPRSLSVASCVGATICSTSPIASDPPVPANVQDVLLVDVTVTVPSAVVVPPLILLSVNAADAVALVLS